jgi:hypothetical protein
MNDKNQMSDFEEYETIFLTFMIIIPWLEDPRKKYVWLIFIWILVSKKNIGFQTERAISDVQTFRIYKIFVCIKKIILSLM